MAHSPVFEVTRTRLQQQVHEQQARVGGLKNFPKITERYVRRSVRKLFTPSKSALVETTTDSTGWTLPKVPQLYAWTRWFAENGHTPRKLSRFRKDRIQVALVVSGGTGDLLESTHLIGAVSRHFSCDVSVIAAQANVSEIVANNPCVTDSMVPVNEHVFAFVDHLCKIPVFDLIIVWKYNIQYIVPVTSRIRKEEIDCFMSYSFDLRQKLDIYCLHSAWPYFNSAFSRHAARLGLSAMEVSVATSGLPNRNLNEIPFFPSAQSLRIISKLLAKPYVTVHHGFDMKYLPARTRNTEYSSTKNLSMSQWSQIVTLLRREEIDVIQLGVVEEERIEGVTHCLNGQTTLEETALLIKHAMCHIDTEGGLVHLAHAVHTRCVVVFGSTPAEFFGYPQNINLEPSACKACWFTTKNWLIECPRHTRGPECMSGHSPGSVADAAKRIIAESQSLSARLIAADPRSPPASLAEAVAAARALLEHEAANRALMIFDDPAATIGSELSDGFVEGSDVIVCADKAPDFPPHDRVSGRLEYGSLINLPRASSSIEVVIWVSCRLESDIVPFALREIFRVLRPGGLFVFAAVAESTRLDLARSLSAGGIGFDENEMPPVPTHSCSLRKTGPQAEGLPRRAGASEMIRGQSDAIDPRLALIEQENMRQISRVRDLVAEQQRVIDQEHFVIEGAVQRGFGGDGWIWVSDSFADGYPSKFFMTGWRDPLDWVIWSRESKCVLMLPYPAEPSSPDRRLELQLDLAIPKASASNPKTIGICVDGGARANFRVSTNDTILTVQASTESAQFRGVSLVEFHLDDAIFHGEGDRLLGSMVMGVQRFRYRLLSS